MKELYSFLILSTVLCSAQGWHQYLTSPLAYVGSWIVDPIADLFYEEKKNHAFYCPQGNSFIVESNDHAKVVSGFLKHCQCKCCPYGEEGQKWNETGTR